MNVQLTNHLFEMLENEVDEFQRWIDDRYKLNSPIGERLSHHAGSIRATVTHLEDVVLGEDTT